MTAKHTPGPWRMKYDVAGHYNVFGPDRTFIVEVAAHGGSAPDNANARLIAAAPELLEACLSMTNLLQATIVKYVGNGTILTDAEWDQVGQARAAIAKAEGRSRDNQYRTSRRPGP